MKMEMIEGTIIGNIYKDEKDKKEEVEKDGIRNKRKDNSTTD